MFLLWGAMLGRRNSRIHPAMKDLSSLKERTLALGGLLQACRAAHEIAQLGMTSNDKLISALETIFITNPKDTLEVYGDVKNIYQGLNLLRELLVDWTAISKSAPAKTAVAIVLLERKLQKSTTLLKELREGIASLSADRERLPLTSGSAETTQRLSALYKKTISQISPKIIIKGQPKNLTIGLNTERIRSLLLAGVRSAVLWRQVGGVKLDLVFNRKKIIRCCEELKK